MGSEIVFYTRRRCPLCDEAKAALDATGRSYVEVDVDTDPAVRAEWGSQVPVLLIDGEVVFSGGEPIENLNEVFTGDGQGSL